MLRTICVVLLLSAMSLAQRLPEVATPERYTLKLTPDLANNTFAGEETITIRVLKSTPVITLNQNEITFQDVTITAGGQTQTAKTELNPQSEMVTLTVSKPVPAGPATIHIRYTGVLNDKLRGFYRAEAEGHKYAVTQFEATDARRAFPSFDEPAYKAVFDITVIAPRKDTVISNSKIVSDKPGPGPDQHTLTFAPTPKMSTYLVAVLVGEFDCIQGGADNIPIRVCTPPGKQELGRFALTASEQVMRFYNQYFGIKYPYGKLDNVAIPDFEAGAMENTGAITYRDVDLLLDPKTASPARMSDVASVIAHEMAHQWFGDLVTMKWWDDIWLNEGFATWMSFKPIEQWKPEWDVPGDEIQSEIGALNADSIQATRPIHEEANTSAQINELFDAIAYNKTAAVLRMVESYVGPQVFREGVNRYLANHAYGNATATDFWTTIAQVSHKPVDKIMSSFVLQPGVPVVNVRTTCKDGKASVQLSQKRFFISPALNNQPNPETWTIPVCLQAPGSTQQSCQLVTQNQQTITFPSCPAWLNANPGGRGYYRVGYSPEAINHLASNATQVSSPELIYLLDNQWALSRSGADSISTFMDLARAAAGSSSHAVFDELNSDLSAISRNLVASTDRTAFEAWVRDLLKPKMDELGWTPAPNDDINRRQLRSEVFFILGYFGRDPQALAQAQKMTQAYLQNPESVDATLAGTVLMLAAQHGSPQLYDEFLARTRTAKTPELYQRYLFSLAEFTDPALLKRTLQLALTPDVRSQDAPFLIASVVGNPAGTELGWQFVQTQWPQIEKKASIAGSAALVGVTGVMCDSQAKQQVQDFFSAHQVPAAARRLRQASERIGDCVEFKLAQQPKLAQWLQQNAKRAGM